MSDRVGIFALIVSGTVVGIAGTDLILPSVPSLPVALHGTVATAQYVLAAYAAGTLIGLLAFGELGARRDPRLLLVWSLVLFTVASVGAVFAPSLPWLIGLRLLQGAFGAAPAVFAPGFIHRLFPPDRAAAMFGRLGSIESLTPAFAPVLGAFLVGLDGWRLPFVALAILCLMCAVVTTLARGRLPAPEPAHARQSYVSILRNTRFLRYGLSQALSLAAVLVFVFGAPAVLTGPLHKGISAFAILQICGISVFILTANASSPLARRFGDDRVMVAGGAVLVLAFAGVLAYALSGGQALPVLIAAWLAVNGGFGIRGPIGFHKAIAVSDGDHSRAAALVTAGLLGATAIGTAIVAPYLHLGLWPLALAGALIAAMALLCQVAIAKR